jgi:hypothetical protein
MAKSEAETLAALQTLYTNLAALQNLKRADMLDSGSRQFYEKTIQEAYDAVMSVEGVLSSLWDALEYEHWRLGGAVEEIHSHI